MTAHIPVLLEAVLAALNPQDGNTYVDGTFGAGGYTRAILGAAKCRVIAIDRDSTTQRFADDIAREFGERFTYIVGNFADMCALLHARGIEQVDGVVLDIGVSSMQIDQAERGFSFKQDGPLDMRMGQGGMSAADVVNTYDEQQLADVLYHLGEEKASRRIAKAIVAARPILRTLQLQAIVANVVGYAGGKDPATRTFQALRMEVNQELQALEAALKSAESLLKPSGKLLVVTFHSLEDRMVKRFFQAPTTSRYQPELSEKQRFAGVKKIAPSEAEMARNSRSRSALLRVAEKAAA